MRKKLISLFFTPIIAVPFIELTSCRENPTWTVMVYLCGSDLETNPLNGGWASSALDKILLSNFGSNVHVVVETGGATSWREHGIANNKLQRYQVINHRMVLKENLATNEMSTDNALSNFIDYGVNNFHADRYAFIFWDHEYAWEGCEKDDNNSNKVLNPLEIKKGFANAFDSSLNHQKFDFVLFDNCLMANAETFCSIYPYTKQVIANEREGKLHAEYKLSCSFDYASLLELLSQQSALANSLIGKYIVDRYAMWQSSHNLKYATGSFDMRYMNVLNTKLIELFDSYTSSSKELWQITGRYAQTFEAGYNLVDLYNWMQCLPNTSEARDIINFFDNTLSYYFRCSNDTPYAHGVNIYFPLTDNWGPESGQEGPYNQAPDYDAIYNTDDIEDSFMKPWSDIVASWYILPA